MSDPIPTIPLEKPAIVVPVPAVPPPMTPDLKNVQANTTAAEDLRTQGQRRVNLIWETTQAIVAVMVTCAMIALAWTGKTSELLASAFGMIVGMYFQRTNHTKIGGIGGTDSR